MQIAEKDRLRFTILSSILLIACPGLLRVVVQRRGAYHRHAADILFSRAVDSGALVLSFPNRWRISDTLRLVCALT